MCRHAFDFDYDPRAPRERLRGFLGELFKDASRKEGGKRQALLAEFVGACLMGTATKYQKLLVIQGGGGNGKSEFLRLARGLFPPGAVASVAPQDWGDRFRSARLVGVLANFVDEIPERDVTAGDVFKSVVTGDPISAERKHQHPFEYRPLAGHILSANVLPGTVDQSDGYWRRFAVCPFTRNFENDPARKADAATEVLRHELPAVVTWALRGAARLQRRGMYTTTKSAAQTLTEWRDEADPVRRFLVERKYVREVGATALFEEWRVFARNNGFADMSSTRFGRRVVSSGLYERDRTKEGRWYKKKDIAA
jgi:putative DNA primase/helicase